MNNKHFDRDWIPDQVWDGEEYNVLFFPAVTLFPSEGWGPGTLELQKSHTPAIGREISDFKWVCMLIIKVFTHPLLQGRSDILVRQMDRQECLSYRLSYNICLPESVESCSVLSILRQAQYDRL